MYTPPKPWMKMISGYGPEPALLVSMGTLRVTARSYRCFGSGPVGEQKHLLDDPASGQQLQ